jgi:excisionase family DNA binding protein
MEALLVDVAEAARVLDCSRSHVRTLAEKGALRPVRLGRAVRFSAAELRAFIEHGGTAPNARPTDGSHG